MSKESFSQTIIEKAVSYLCSPATWPICSVSSDPCFLAPFSVSVDIFESGESRTIAADRPLFEFGQYSLSEIHFKWIDHTNCKHSWFKRRRIRMNFFAKKLLISKFSCCNFWFEIFKNWILNAWLEHWSLELADEVLTRKPQYLEKLIEIALS